jgi:hypothetical protein
VEDVERNGIDEKRKGKEKWASNGYRGKVE